jgi:hypothetical protein
MKRILLFIYFIVEIESNGQTFRMISVAAFDDKILSSAVFTDIEVMKTNCLTISKGINYNFSSTILSNDNFNSTSILKALDTLKVEDQDIIFFYYTGHGFNDGILNSRFPILKLSDFEKNKLSIDNISAILRSKKARLVITMGDLCNNFLAKKEKGMGKPILLNGGIVQLDANKILRQLFLDINGYVKIASSEKGQFSNADENGSFYTKAFYKTLTEAIDKNSDITWKSLLEDAQQRLELLLPFPKQRSIYDINGDVFPPEENPIKPEPIEPVVTFDQINRYLNLIANEKEDLLLRQKAIKNANKYFIEKAHVKLFVNETETESQSIERLLKRLYLNAPNIIEVNVIEKMSLLESTQNKYKIIAVQEVWNK